MKINKTTRIIGKNVILVPYREHHVLKYHEWMKSVELQNLTASESLSLEEEYQMQKSWQEDDDKCTFIILNKEKYEETANEIDAMIGDTNFFFNNPDNKHEAETEIMIAEISNRGKGYGREATLLMLRYGIEKLHVSKYIAKIHMQNEKSIRMFKKLGFNEVAVSNIFNEVTLSKEVDKQWHNYVISGTLDFTIDENYK